MAGSQHGTLKFKPGTAVAAQVVVKVIGDTLDEVDESFEVHLSNPQGGGGFTIARPIDTVTIRDDDASSGVQMSIGEPATSEVVVQWGVTGDTAICAKATYENPTQPGQDCVNSATLKTLRFKPVHGFTPVSKMVSVALFADATDDGTQETFHVTLSNLSGAGAAMADVTGIGTILDDD